MSGSLDLLSAPGLGTALDRLRCEGSRHIVLDLAWLDFVDAIGLGVFVDADRRCGQRGNLDADQSEPDDASAAALTELDAVLTVE